MSTFRVTEVGPPTAPWKSRSGGEMVSYYIKGHYNNGPEESAQINTLASKPKVPFIGEMIECTVEREHPQYGKTLKRVAPTPSPSQTQPSFNSTAKREYVPSPASEIPYLSLKAAVEFGSARVNAKLDIDGEQIIAMAQIFQKYLEGELRFGKVPVVQEDDLKNFDEDQGPYSDEEQS